MAVSPPSITALPLAPDPNDRSTFNARAYPWSVALGVFTDEVNALGSNVFSNAAEAYSSALTAEAQAQAAVASVNSPKWVAGTNYAAGAAVWSPTTGRTYRAKVALNPSSTDPALDATNWWDVASLSGRPFTVLDSGGNATPGFYHLLTGAGTLVLPTTNLVVGTTVVEFLDISNSDLVFIDPGANKIRGATGTMKLDVRYASGTLVWSGETYGWV